jgi:hypothetical protein
MNRPPRPDRHRQPVEAPFESQPRRGTCTNYLEVRAVAARAALPREERTALRTVALFRPLSWLDLL